MPRTRLPLFPLGSVLFPGLVLPLHVFEERYRTLVADLMALPADEPRQFGVVAIREGREVGRDGARALYEVGCIAEVHEIEAHEDGRFDVVTTGAARFRLHGLDRSGPYLVGDVEVVDEPSDDPAAALVPGVGRLFTRYRDRLLRSAGAPSGELPELPDDPSVLSYLVAAAIVLDLHDKQGLLEEPDTASRLRTEIGVLRRETSILTAIPSVPAVELLGAAVSAN